MSTLQSFIYTLSTDFSWLILLVAVIVVASATYFCAQNATSAAWRGISLIAEICSVVSLVSLGTLVCNHYFDERAEETELKITRLKRSVLDQQGLVITSCFKNETLHRVTPDVIKPHILCKIVENLQSPYSKEFYPENQIQLIRSVSEQLGHLDGSKLAESSGQTLSKLTRTLTELEGYVGDLSQKQYERDLVRRGMSEKMLWVLLLFALVAISFKTARAFKEWFEWSRKQEVINSLSAHPL